MSVKNSVDCLGHLPDWEDIEGEERVVESPWMGLIKTRWWASRHCGRRLRRVVIMRRHRCRKCGRVEYYNGSGLIGPNMHVCNEGVGLCDRCGVRILFEVEEGFTFPREV